MNNKVLTIVIIAVIILLGAAGLIVARQAQVPTSENPANGTSQTPTSDSQPESTPSPADASEVSILYTNDGFTTPSITAKSGDTIRVQNDSSSTLSFNSDDHPTHAKQPVLNVGEIMPGQSKTFTVNTAGTWGFHNHLNPAHAGSLAVQ